VLNSDKSNPGGNTPLLRDSQKGSSPIERILKIPQLYFSKESMRNMAKRRLTYPTNTEDPPKHVGIRVVDSNPMPVTNIVKVEGS
jgi:hypothetical protein